MPTTKLTLSIAPEVIAKARRISKHRKTSVSAMFARYISTLEDSDYKEKLFTADDKTSSRACRWSS